MWCQAQDPPQILTLYRRMPYRASDDAARSSSCERRIKSSSRRLNQRRWTRDSRRARRYWIKGRKGVIPLPPHSIHTDGHGLNTSPKRFSRMLALSWHWGRLTLTTEPVSKRKGGRKVASSPRYRFLIFVVSVQTMRSVQICHLSQSLGRCKVNKPFTALSKSPETVPLG